MNLRVRAMAIPTLSGYRPHRRSGLRRVSTVVIRSDISVVRVSRLAAATRNKILRLIMTATMRDAKNHWHAAITRTKSRIVREMRHTTANRMRATANEMMTTPSATPRMKGEFTSITEVPQTHNSASFSHAGVR